MTVETRAVVLPPIYNDYHALSYTLNMFKIFKIVDDSLDRLTMRMIAQKLLNFVIEISVWLLQIS